MKTYKMTKEESEAYRKDPRTPLKYRIVIQKVSEEIWNRKLKTAPVSQGG